ncbi:MAG: ZIP family metal transporter [Candidatus Promineifilaceae bacterium]|nr:ZIP family metal transporter [Candidatus Promineifilaceae bacterium]
MLEWLHSLDPIVQALLATGFTWLATALGAAMVIFFRRVNRKLLDGMLGFAAGVMIAASIWSLLTPAIALAEAEGVQGWIPAAVGFLLGGAFVFAIDKVLPHLHLGFSDEEAEGLPTRWRRSVLLVLAITLHNLPEGLAVGVAFGAAGAGVSESVLGGAVALAIGMALQNFPEGMAVSIPLRREGMSRWRAFLYGQASGAVEPLAGLLGAVAVLTVRELLPLALAFAAGAMIFVVVEELIPESQLGKNTDIATAGTMLGFTVMMILDVALG